MSFILDPDKPSEVPITKSDLDEEKKPGRIFLHENALSEDQFKALNYTEQVFWLTGDFPSIQQIKDNTPLNGKDAEEYYSHPVVLDCVAKRGLDVNKLVGATSLTAEQLLVANMVLNLQDPNSLRQKLKAVKITPHKYETWMRDPVFAGYIRARAEAMFVSADGAAYAGLIKAVQDQDTAAIKLFFEMRGIYNPRLDLNVNIESVLVKVVEIVSRHVTDKRMLIAIADEIEDVVTPKAISA